MTPSRTPSVTLPFRPSMREIIHEAAEAHARAHSSDTAGLSMLADFIAASPSLVSELGRKTEELRGGFRHNAEARLANKIVTLPWACTQMGTGEGTIVKIIQTMHTTGVLETSVWLDRPFGLEDGSVDYDRNLIWRTYSDHTECPGDPLSLLYRVALNRADVARSASTLVRDALVELTPKLADHLSDPTPKRVDLKVYASSDEGSGFVEGVVSVFSTLGDRVQLRLEVDDEILYKRVLLSDTLPLHDLVERCHALHQHAWEATL